MSDDLPKITLAQVERDAAVLIAIGRALDPFDRNTQLRIMESVCTLLGDDGSARQFRALREAPGGPPTTNGAPP